MTIHESHSGDFFMTFDQDIDPKMWKAEREAYITTIKHLREVVEHSTKKQQEYQSRYFGMKELFEIANNKLMRLYGNNDMETYLKSKSSGS